MRPISNALASLGLVMISVALGFVMVELGWRAIDNRDVFVWRNWFAWSGQLLAVHTMSIYDPLLGWRLADDVRSAHTRTTRYGIRYNGVEEPRLIPGQIVAVGDSFTAGSEVLDSETWPAHLERMLGRPVYNAGVGGFGTDQIILRGEQMLQLLRPEILIVGFLESDIARSQYSVWGGGTKPYFTLRDGQLVHHNFPVPLAARASNARDPASLLDYSYFYFRVLQVFAYETWLVRTGPEYRKIDNDPVSVTCRLLGRLKTQADAVGTKVRFLMQHGGPTVRSRNAPQIPAQLVVRCAEDFEIPVVDEFEALHAIAVRNPEELKRYYVMHDSGQVYGHMSDEGNRLVAELLARAIRGEPNRSDRRRSEGSRNSIADQVQVDTGKALLNGRHLANAPVATANATLAATDVNIQDQTVYELRAGGPDGEHYLSTERLPAAPGRYTLSIWVDRSRTTPVRLQLFDVRSLGAVIDIFPSTDVVSLRDRGDARPVGGLIASDGAWRRYALSVDTKGDQAIAIVQLLDGSGNNGFVPKGEAAIFRGLKVERVGN